MSRRIAVGLILVGFAVLVWPWFPQKGSPVTALDEVLEKDWILPIPVPLLSLDPQVVLSATEKSLMLLTFSRLVKPGNQLQIEADMLEKWSYDLDNKRLLLVLREGVRFHSGRELAAQDVLFSFHHWAHPSNLDSNLLDIIRGVKDYRNGNSKSIEGIRAIGDRHITVDLVNWGADQLIRNLTEARFCIYPNHFGGRSQEEFFQKPDGTGPYQLVSYTPEKVEYAANRDYYLGAPKTEHITLQYLDEKSAVQAFRNREVNNLIMYHLSDLKDLVGAGVIVRRLSRANTFSAIFNASNPKLVNEDIRQYIAAKIPKKELVRECFPGSDIAQSLIPPGVIGSNSEPKSLLPLKTVKPPKDFGFVFYTLQDENGNCTSKVFNEAFQGLPLRTEVRTFPELYALLKQGKLHGWAESHEFKSDDPYQTLRYFTESSNEFLLGKPVPLVESLFKRLTEGGVSYAERADLYRQIDSTLVDRAHVVPILHFGNFAVFRSNIDNLEFLRTGRFTANWHKIKVRRVHEK